MNKSRQLTMNNVHRQLNIFFKSGFTSFLQGHKIISFESWNRMFGMESFERKVRLESRKGELELNFRVVLA